MGLIVFSTVGIRRDQSAVFELHGGSKAASLRFVVWCFVIDEQAVGVEVEREAVALFGADKSLNSQRRVERANREGGKQSAILQPQQRRVHLPVFAEIAYR